MVGIHIPFGITSLSTGIGMKPKTSSDTSRVAQQLSSDQAFRATRPLAPGPLAVSVPPLLLPAGGRLRLRHLQCFLAVARLGRLRAAADALAVTQPAITKTLNELEDILQVRLFERSRRGVTLTPSAHVFLRHASAAVEALGQAVESVRHEPGRAPLRIGTLPTVTAGLLAPAIVRFHAAHPDITIRAVTGSNTELIELLRAREVDVAVTRLSDPREMPGLSFEFLYAEALVIVVRPGHPLLRKRLVTTAMFGDYRLVLPPTGTLIRHSAESFLAASGAGHPDVAVESLSVSLARSLVLGSDAIWFTSPSAITLDLSARHLVALNLDTTGTEEPIGLLLRSDLIASPIMTSLLDALRHCAATRRTVSERA